MHMGLASATEHSVVRIVDWLQEQSDTGDEMVRAAAAKETFVRSRTR
jgi:hypothetical protein